MRVQQESMFKILKGFDDKKCETDKTNIDNEIEKISQINKVIDEHTNVIASLELHYTQVSVKLRIWGLNQNIWSRDKDT